MKIFHDHVETDKRHIIFLRVNYYVKNVRLRQTATLLRYIPAPYFLLSVGINDVTYKSLIQSLLFMRPLFSSTEIGELKLGISNSSSS